MKDVKSPERLLDETALFLHRVEEALPEPKRRMLRSLEQPDPALRGRSVLVVDDDYRNVFAITAVLEQHEMEVDYADNGRSALDKLGKGPDRYDVVLMDIMMPEMDGYEAMRRIRERPELRDLPVIALTANAVAGNEARCFGAGMDDFIAKPFEIERLIEILKRYLTVQRGH